jgi:ribosome-binding factor A
METRRVLRIADLIRNEISGMLVRELKDPRIGLVTITQVKVSPDLGRAKVFYSVVGAREKPPGCQAGLESAARFIRARLAKRLSLRRVPELGFEYDYSLNAGAVVSSILEELNKAKPGEDG